MSLKRFLPQLLILSLAIITTDCTVPDEFDPDKYNTNILWEPGLQAPLVYGDLSIEDILMEFNEEGFLSEDDSGFLFFVYDTSETMVASDYLPPLPDQNFVHVFFSVPYDLPPDSLGVLWDTTLWSQDKSFKFERSGDERLDSIELKAGQVIIDVVSTIRHAGILEIHSASIDDENGQPYMERIVISDSTGTFTDQETLDLSGYSVRLDNSNPDSSFLDLAFDFYLINSGNSILSSEVVDIRMRFQNLEFQTVYGFAGTYDSLILDRETLDFELLDFDLEGTVKLYDPKLHLDIWNSFGLTFGIELLDMEARFSDSPDLAINITDPAANPIIVNAPTPAQAGESVQTEVTIDRNNSNIHEIGTTDLRGLQYSVRALANPGAETDNFLQDTSKLTVNLEVTIPLHLRIEDVVFRDTFEFDLSEDLEDFEPEDIKSMFMRLETENGLPLDIETQVYFMDSTTTVTLDSLFDNTNRNILPAGILDNDGKVYAPSVNPPIDVILTQDQIQNIWDAKTIAFEATVETKDNMDVVRDVKFYSYYSLYFKLSAGAEISISTE